MRKKRISRRDFIAKTAAATAALSSGPGLMTAKGGPATMGKSSHSEKATSNSEPILLGYADQVSVAPDEVVRFMVSSEAQEYSVEIVRLIHGDDNGAGPGFKEQAVQTDLGGPRKGRPQAINCGSYVEIARNPELPANGSFSIQAWILPTTPKKGMQGLITKWSADESEGYGLFIDEGGRLALGRSGKDGAARWVHTEKPLQAWFWHFVAAAYDGLTGRVCMYQKSLAATPFKDSDSMVTKALDPREIASPKVPLCIGAYVARTDQRRIMGGHFNGKIDRPSLFKRVLTPDEIASLERDMSALSLGDAVIAAWDFSREMSTKRVVDGSGNGFDGWTVNMPARAVTDHKWSGDMYTCFSVAPESYGAIHFHDDDLEDAEWDVDFELRVPDTLRSGIYAARLRAEKSEFHIPFVVRPKKNQPASAIAFLAPSLTWQAYANFNIIANPIANPFFGTSAEALPWQKEDEFIAAHPELGVGTYDHHSDGGSPYYSSRLRPNLSGGPRYKDSPTACRHLLSADLYVVDWLTTKGFPFDVVSDDDLHFDGEELLRPYRVLITGAHPEYWTAQMLAGLDAFLVAGGRLMYLGGNGLYWVTSLRTETRVIEVRRSIGTRLSHAEDGEFYHNTTGERGGIWRAFGQAPQKRLGVGFSAQGGAPGSPYRRQPDSFNPRARFIFEGIGDDEIIGGFGLNTNAAAGFEIDRLDYRLGTPPHTLLLASSSNHHESYWHAVEEVDMTGPHESAAACRDVRADMTFYEHSGGGAVFSVGSISWTGSLSHNGYDNNVSRITGNVLRRFLSGEPFV